MQKRGFTLIELVIYTAITASITSAIVFTSRAMYDARARVRTSSIVHEQIRFALSRSLASVRESSSIVSPETESSGDSLSVVINAVTTTIRLADGRLYLQEDGSEELPITSNEIAISSVEFTRSSTDPPIVRVEVSGDLRESQGAYHHPFTLTGSASVRRE